MGQAGRVGQEGLEGRDRNYPARPIVGVGAIVVDGSRVLLVKRGHEPLKGQWSVPGGAVELGETLEAAVAREVLEETGVEVEVGPIVEVLDRVARSDDGRVEYHYVLIDYLCRATGGALCCASDADAAEWADIEGLERIGVAQTTITVVRKGASMARLPRKVDRHAK